MFRQAKRLKVYVVFALALAFAGAAFAQGPQSKPAPQPDASESLLMSELCALLDIPAKRNLMDGLLYVLIRACGRDFELGQVVNQEAEEAWRLEEAEESKENIRLITAAMGLADVQVNNSATDSDPVSTTQSETSIARNPVTGTTCAAYNDSAQVNAGGGFTGFSRSTNGGQIWQDRGSVGARAFGDPSLVWRHRDGLFYLATLDGNTAGLAIWVSNDDCQTFVLRSVPFTGGDDKEILAVDNNPASPHYGNLYLAWTDFGLVDDPIRVSRSTDGGLNWSAPVTVSTGGIVQGAWPAVAPDGTVYVAWLLYTDFQNGPITIQVARSTNGGLSFAQVTSPLANAVSPRHAAASVNCGRPSLNGNIRYLASPQLAVDHAGTLHIVYSYDPDGFNVGDVVNVYYRRSTNGGASWSAEVRLNDDATTRDQYFPAIRVAGSTLMASWYDRRLDANNFLQDYYKRVSLDGGVTWSASERVSDVSTTIRLDPNTAACYHGDYDQSLVEVAQWADDRRVFNGHNDADVWSDRTAAAASYEGYHEHANCRYISGWAWDRQRPETAINVDVRDGATFLASVPASGFRQDLLNAGKGNGYHAFTYVTPNSVKNGQWHSINVRFGGTASDLTWTPLSLICNVSIFTTQTPAEFGSTDGRIWSVGNDFSSSVSGYITHLRYYRAAEETGVHTLKLWTLSGTELGSVTFDFGSDLTAGWEEGQLPGDGIAIQAGVTYTVTVTTFGPRQSKTACGFSTPISNGPLTATGGRWVEGNGIFPTNGSCSNFWTDVKFGT